MEYKYNPGQTDEICEYHFPEVVNFFSKISTTIHKFSKENNLYIDRYYHDSPAWRLLFNHPLGGVGCISLIYTGNLSPLKITSQWSSFEEDFRILEKSIWCSIFLPQFRQERILNCLEKQYKNIVQWRRPPVIE